MQLNLSTTCPWNTTFCNTDGQVIYKTESPFHFCLGPRPITIKRIQPTNVDLKSEYATLVDSEDALRDSFSQLAVIDYNYFLASRIRYNGMDVSTTEFLKKEGFFASDRVFRGPDGKEYEWHLGSRVCKLYLKDGSKSLVAAYHRRSLGIIGEAHPAYLEICPQGEHMVDLIVVTFVFVEKLRSDRERNRQAARGGGGGP